MREIIGKSFPYEMVFLQGAEGVLKDRIVRTGLYSIEQLREVSAFWLPIRKRPSEVLKWNGFLGLRTWRWPLAGMAC
jgi:hypothetical protein